MFIYVIKFWEIGCCDVMSSMDMNIVKIIMDVCDRVVEKTDQKTNLELCSQEIFNTCAINITDLVSGNQVGYVSYKKHIFSEIRSLNGSLCLKYHYGVPLASLGVPHRLKDYDPLTSKELSILLLQLYTKTMFGVLFLLLFNWSQKYFSY